jgi:hypothetical protein
MLFRCYNKIWNLNQFLMIEIQPDENQICFTLPAGGMKYQKFGRQEELIGAGQRLLKLIETQHNE